MYLIEANAVTGWRALALDSSADVAVESVRFLADRSGIDQLRLINYNEDG